VNAAHPLQDCSLADDILWRRDPSFNEPLREAGIQASGHGIFMPYIRFRAKGAHFELSGGSVFHGIEGRKDPDLQACQSRVVGAQRQNLLAGA
jgi:hypothetical protein